MTTSTDRIEAIFQDARELQADALQILAQGRIRNAAEKAWGATRRATDALVLAKTGEEPELSPETSAPSSCWHRWTRESEELTSGGGTMPARASSTAPASISAAVNRSRTPSG